MDNVTAGSECPLLHPGRPLHQNVRIAIYCRLPGGRVRVPAEEEQRRHCLTGRWPECPVYRDHATAP